MSRRVALLSLLLIAPPSGMVLGGSDHGLKRVSIATETPQGNPLTSPLPWTSAERALFADASDGRLDEHSLLAAALVACDVRDSAVVERCRRQLARMHEALSRLAIDGSHPLDGFQLIHQVLHRCLLTGGYDANATDLATTIDTGVYNCASATLLFIALAEEFHLPAYAVQLPGHVRAVVDCGAERYEIEVTSPSWVAAVRKAVASAATNPTGVPSNQRKVSDLGLVAMIYYNRGIDAFNQHQFAAAVAANRCALLLDPANSSARGNLLAAINNWSLALCDDGQYAAAESLLIAGRSFAPEHTAFDHNAAHIEWVRAQSRTSGSRLPQAN